MSNRTDIEALAYAIDALRRQEARYRSSYWPIPGAVPELLEDIGFRVSRGQARSTNDNRGDHVERVVQSPSLLVNYKAAAQLLAISESTVKRLIKAGELHPVTIGGAARLRRSELEQFVADATSNGGR